MFNPKHWLAVVLTLISIAAMARSSQAQQFSLPMAIGEAFGPDYVRRDLTALNEDLHLDAQQRTVVESLFADYETAFRKAMESTRQQMQELTPLATIDEEARLIREEQIRERVAELVEQVQKMRTDMPLGEEGEALRKEVQERAAAIRNELAAINGDTAPTEDLLKALAKTETVLATWQVEKDRLRSEFDAGVQAILTDEQREHWPAVERRIRRDRMLSRGRLSGESLNVLLILSQQPLSEDARSAIAADVTAFELKLDAALKNRDAVLRQSNLELLQAMHQKDRAKAQAVAARVVKARVVVRDVNDEALQTLTGRMPADIAPKFLAAGRERGYPKVFRVTTTQRLLNAAQELPGLNPEQVEAVNQLEAAWLAELNPGNDRLLAAMREAEPLDMELRLVRSAVGGEEDVEPTLARLEAEMDARVLLEKRFESQLESLLGDENWQKLPHRRLAESEIVDQ